MAAQIRRDVVRQNLVRQNLVRQNLVRMNLVRMNVVRNSMQSSHRAGSLPLIGAHERDRRRQSQAPDAPVDAGKIRVIGPVRALGLRRRWHLATIALATIWRRGRDGSLQGARRLQPAPR